MSEAMELYNKGLAKHPGGAPTKYSQEVVEKAYHYLMNYNEYGKNIPSIARLAQALDVTEVTLYEWAKHDDKKEFSNALAKIKQLQKIELMENGLASNYNSNITKLMMYNHGFSEKQDVNTTITVTKVERLIIDVSEPVTEVIEGEVIPEN